MSSKKESAEDRSLVEAFPNPLVGVRRVNEYKFRTVLKNILPFIGSEEGKIILAEVMIALKIEGIIGKNLSKSESSMVEVIKQSIISEPSKRKEALSYAKKLLQSSSL